MPQRLKTTPCWPWWPKLPRWGSQHPAWIHTKLNRMAILMGHLPDICPDFCSHHCGYWIRHHRTSGHAFLLGCMPIQRVITNLLRFRSSPVSLPFYAPSSRFARSSTWMSNKGQIISVLKNSSLCLPITKDRNHQIRHSFGSACSGLDRGSADASLRSRIRQCVCSFIGYPRVCESGCGLFTGPCNSSLPGSGTPRVSGGGSSKLPLSSGLGEPFGSLGLTKPGRRQYGTFGFSYVIPGHPDGLRYSGS